jgi:hypothetical protein
VTRWRLSKFSQCTSFELCVDLFMLVKPQHSSVRPRSLLLQPITFVSHRSSSMHTQDALNSDDEYEYEYDEKKTEVGLAMKI